MRLIVTICVFCLLLKNSESRIYEPCRLAKELYYVYGIPREDIPHWLCHIDKMSACDTSLVTKKGGNKSYGLFQVDNVNGCHRSELNRKGVPGRPMCRSSCSVLSDDNISNDVKCIMIEMRRISYTAREYFADTCKHTEPNVYLYGCNI